MPMVRVMRRVPIATNTMPELDVHHFPADVWSMQGAIDLRMRPSTSGNMFACRVRQPAFVAAVTRGRSKPRNSL
jgi:hypothetical protein